MYKLGSKIRRLTGLGTTNKHITLSRVVYIMLDVSHYYANSFCSETVTIMLKEHYYYA